MLIPRFSSRAVCTLRNPTECFLPEISSPSSNLCMVCSSWKCHFPFWSSGTDIVIVFKRFWLILSYLNVVCSEEKFRTVLHKSWIVHMVLWTSLFFIYCYIFYRFLGILCIYIFRYLSLCVYIYTIYGIFTILTTLKPDDVFAFWFATADDSHLAFALLVQTSKSSQETKSAVWPLVLWVWNIVLTAINSTEI